MFKKTLLLTLNEDIHKIIKERADEIGMPVATYLRFIISELAKKPTKTIKTKQSLEEIQAEADALFAK